MLAAILEADEVALKDRAEEAIHILPLNCPVPLRIAEGGVNHVSP